MLTDKKIGVLMGGASSEREVSLRSGSAVFKALKKLGYNAAAIDAGPNICEALKKEKIDIATIFNVFFIIPIHSFNLFKIKLATIIIRQYTNH